MKKTVVIHESFYIAVQDGRLDDETFDTRKEAETARGKLPVMLRNSTCVMSRTETVETVTLDHRETRRAKRRMK